MTGMPFYIEKGPQFSVIESFVLDDRERGITLLDTLRAGGTPAAGALSAIAANIGLDSSDLDKGGQSADSRMGHLDRHWFERTRDKKTGKWSPDPSTEYPAVDDKGRWNWWHAYAGDVYEIMRQTMITAAEVSLGVAPGADARLHGRQDPWPIELFWHCGQNWFEGWVTWRRHGAAGQVTVLLCTPTAGAPVRPSPLAGAAPKGEQGRAFAPPYSEKPQPQGKSRGMVVVTHHHHEYVQDGPVHVMAQGSPQGQLLTPGLGGESGGYDYWRGVGPVVRVMPSEPDGGVLPGGRSYTS